MEELVLFVVDVYKALGLAKRFKIDEPTLVNFVSAVQKRYHDHPFHNFRHGFSVMQTAYILVRDSELGNVLTELDTLALITSALCHDIDHPGVSNDHLINAGSALALMYNDRSVLENHHTFTLFELLRKPQYNILGQLTDEEFSMCRKMMISAIMATDMKQHMMIASRAQALVHKMTDSGEFPLTIQSEVDRETLIELVLHTCDLSGQTMCSSLAKAWTKGVLSEFIQQAEREAVEGIPVAPFMQGLDDRLNQVKTQIAFISYVVQPLWNTFSIIFPKAKFAYDNLQNNLKEYELEKTLLESQ